jgi:hypothetical protein
MNNDLTSNIPSNNKILALFCYNAEVVNGETMKETSFYPVPVFAKNLEEAKNIMSEVLDIPVSHFGKWEVIGDEDGFAPSIYIEIEDEGSVIIYSFDVFTTVNTLHLV